MVRVLDSDDVRHLVTTATGFHRNPGPGLSVSGTEVVITSTGGKRLVIEADWSARGAHVTAVGSGQCRTSRSWPRGSWREGEYVPDSLDAAADSGELHHVLEAGSGYGELTAVAPGRLLGRIADDELTVADLTGLGIRCAAVAALAARLADEHGVGRDVPPGNWCP
ncbi:hypothetical protein [Allokutzneria albata]|uniref:hypothetical protein n=1 Tax=Allokutzneria albata TaxID=211114 RepID=UPI0004C419C4|nr:hypothetical protein [Allokutzneria albata]